ncbi:helix-turn-helix domain-containing protein [Klebsiella pneumoniae]|uniref:helix-turn-helix domain-containing protein n=1 Tax=Enterobacteriaceae TaxID=543 RepID=UPI00111C6B78|nr:MULTISPECIES: helix-turn-helix domain-containing protein [Klebsiella]EJE5322768.1 helix-turn-helix domain-containing protein [Escherichia coli]EKW6101852.1 helix-turn-helix domain-containing protein [Klebsiella pneumoniae]EKZ9726792.1 helix-turn-helix domain-containing protein [Klebsiella pneumoniae]ELA0558444.1 helix-turn-helix domain-containing protein [Klebsiella pneumoniae]ELA2584457.1 helix-turn-helix domain-containing protein [Klebsiella pneumoniae]
MNKNEPPFLAIDYRILALDIKAAINKKTIDSSTILKLKLVYCYLLGFSKTCEEVYPEQTKMGKKLGIGSRQVVGRCISLLESLGWISKTSRTGTSNLYTVKTVEQILEGIPREVKEEEEEKEFHDFNTGIVLIEDDDDLPW